MKYKVTEYFEDASKTTRLLLQENENLHFVVV